MSLVCQSVFRTAPIANGPEITAAGSVFALRKRLDGGYSIARRNANTAEITPDHFRLLADFWPRLRANRNEIRLRVGRRSWEELRTRRKWTMDDETPFEATRVLDPPPQRSHPGGRQVGAITEISRLRRHASGGELGRAVGVYSLGGRLQHNNLHPESTQTKTSKQTIKPRVTCRRNYAKIRL